MARPATSLAFQDDQALLTPGPVRDRLLAQMRRQGAKDVRLNVIYGRTRAEGYGKLDNAVQAIRAAGLHPQMTLMGTPRYSPQWDQTLSATHNNPRVWQAFAAEVAKRYRGQVGRYSIDNEPNHPAFLAGADTNPRAAGRQYRGIFRAGETGIQQADPTAQVLLGEITNQKGARKFLQGVMGGKPIKAAGFAYHPYASPGSDAWDMNNLADLQATLGRYKRQGRLQTAKGQAVPLYLTEFGLQQNTGTSAARLQQLGRAYAQAKAVGARQLLQYQLLPTVRPSTPGVPVRDGYGNTVGWGAAGRQPGWVWDTSIGDASGNIPVINRGMRVTPPVKLIARAAKVRKRGK